MGAGVVKRCYGGGGGGDQEQALLRRACVFPGSGSLLLRYQNRNRLAKGSTHSVGSQSRAFKYIVPLYLRNSCCSTIPLVFDFSLDLSHFHSVMRHNICGSMVTLLQCVLEMGNTHHAPEM